MGARRTIGPAAIAAALIGAGLALYRPGGVPRLRPGGRVSTPASLASPIAWSAPPVLVPPSADSTDAVRVEEGAATSYENAAVALERAALRDAPADFPYATGPARASARSAARAASAVGTKHDEASPADAGGSAPPSRATKFSSRARERLTTSAPAAPAARRVPLFKGPAPADAETVEEESEPAAVDVGGGGARRVALSSRRQAPFPLFRPPKRTESFKRAAAARRRRARPPLLSKMLGRGALRPPPSSLKPPDLAGLKDRRPSSLPDGSAVPARPPDLLRLETLDPRKAGAASDRRKKPHWDDGRLWHHGEARGVLDDARWLWLWTKGSRWWAAPEPDGPPLLHHHGLWWSKRRGVWFVQHEGEPWTWRRFAEWDAQGLVNLRDGVQLLYSADFSKVAVLTPGEGAVLYDAATGAELGQWLESELPRRRPRPPSGLRLPRGI